MSDLAAELLKQKEWARAVVFGKTGKVVAQKASKASEGELKALATAYASREAAVSAGVVIDQQLFEVHRFHPPLIYGRKADIEKSEGFSLARGLGPNNEEVFLLITYALPIVSARAIPQQIEFFNAHLGSLDKAPQS